MMEELIDDIKQERQAILRFLSMEQYKNPAVKMQEVVLLKRDVLNAKPELSLLFAITDMMKYKTMASQSGQR